MARPDVFALANSGLDAFLRGEVGTELNGSTLTILSALARLGFDPWVEAARWARLPRAATIDRLAGLIAQMPLCPQSLGEARGTATRLALLLPGQARQPASDETRSPLPVIALATGICLALALAFVINNFASSVAPPKPAMQAGQSVEQKGR
jgi:hypothetical protein